MKTIKANSDVSFLNENHDLIEACKRGDQKAQFKIYKLYYKAMYNISLRIVQNPADAEDIMQESFLTAFEKITSWSGAVSFGAWLIKIVQNRSLDYLRRNSRYVFEDIETISDTQESCPDNSFTGEETDMRLMRILEIIRELPSKWRDIISLYFFEGYDYEEIAEILSIPPNTLRSNVSRARQRIIKKMNLKA